MNFHELEAFMTLADELHFGKASAKLNMSPSALSRVISRLEDEFQIILLDRSNRQVILTQDGKQFYKFAKETCDSYKDFKVSVCGKKDVLKGTLHLYASVTACYSVLPEFIKKFTSLYPEIQLSVETGDPAGAIQAVKK